MRKTIRLAALAVSGMLMLTGCRQADAKKAYTAAGEALLASDYDAAVSGYSAVIDLGCYLPEAYRGKGIAEMSQGNYADAAISLEKSLLNVESQSEEFQRDVNLYLAYCRERQGNTDKAMAIYDQLILQSPDAETLYLRGRLHLHRGESRAAESDFNQAVLLDPNYDLFINIYQLYEDMERSGDGAHYLEMALSEASRNAEDYYEQGLVSYYLQNYSDARDMLIKAMRKDPDDGRAIYLLGQVYLASGDVADARALYWEYTDKPETAATAYNGLALCDIREGKYESALENVEAGLALNDESANEGLLYNEIVLYEQMHDWQTAKKKAAAYAARYPGNEAGVREYTFLSTR